METKYTIICFLIFIALMAMGIGTAYWIAECSGWPDWIKFLILR